MGGTKSKPSPPPPLLDNPWRVIDWGAKEKLLKYVRNYKPDGASQVRVLVFGPVGAGKSSFINSVGSVIAGRRVYVAAASTSNATTSFTLEFKTHQFKFKDSEKQTMPIVFNDMMGMEAGTNRGVKTEDIKLAMKGHVKEGYTFNPLKVLSQDNKYFNADPSIDDKVHLLVCMLNANAIEIHASILDEMKEIRELARDLGIPQVAVVTQIDQICGETEKNIADVYRSRVLKTKMDLFSAKVGIPIYNTYAVWNSYEGRHKEAADILILTALKDMLGFGDDCIDDIC